MKRRSFLRNLMLAVSAIYGTTQLKTQVVEDRSALVFQMGNQTGKTDMVCFSFIGDPESGWGA